MTAQQLEEAIFFVKMKECQVKVDESMRLCISVYQSRTLIIRLFLKPLGFMLLLFKDQCYKIQTLYSLYQRKLIGKKPVGYPQ